MSIATAICHSHLHWSESLFFYLSIGNQIHFFFDKILSNWTKTDEIIESLDAGDRSKFMNQKLIIQQHERKVNKRLETLKCRYGVKHDDTLWDRVQLYICGLDHRRDQCVLFFLVHSVHSFHLNSFLLETNGTIVNSV